MFTPKTEIDYFTLEAAKRLCKSSIALVMSALLLLFVIKFCVGASLVQLILPCALPLLWLSYCSYRVLRRLLDFLKLYKFRDYSNSFEVEVVESTDE